MDWGVVTQVIGTLGFPICASIALFWQLNKTNEQHKEELGALRETLAQNTIALVELRNAIKRDVE